MSKVQSYIYIAVIVLVLFGLAVFWNSIKVDQQPIASPQPSISSAPTAVASSVVVPADWTTYEDKRYEYTIKLPPGTKVEVTGELEDCTKFAAPGGAFLYVGSYQTGKLVYEGYCGPDAGRNFVNSYTTDNIKHNEVIDMDVYEYRINGGPLLWSLIISEYGSSYRFGVDRIVVDEKRQEEQLKVTMLMLRSFAAARWRE